MHSPDRGLFYIGGDMKTVMLSAMIVAGATSAGAARPSLDRIILCRTADPDWGGLLEKPWRRDLIYRDHYSGEEDEHAIAYPKGVVAVLSARLVSIYTANGEHEDGSSHAILNGDYAVFMKRARAFYVQRRGGSGRLEKAMALHGRIASHLKATAC